MKHILIFIFSTFFLSNIAFANLYEVTNVDSTDSLNMRSSARASSSVVTTLPYNAKQITVIKTINKHHRKWSKISWKGKTGWVNAYYLQQQATTNSLQTFQCGGTEPFWGLDIMANNTVKFTNYDMGNFQAPISFQKIPAGRPPEIGIRITKAVSSNHSALIVTHREMCSDGMSDINYPYSITVLMNGDTALEGCCKEVPSN